MQSDLSRLEQAFDEESGSYDDKYASSWVMPLLRRRFRRIAADHLPAGGRLLEIGCGTGEDALHFAALGHRVTGIDPSLEMLKVLAEKAEVRGEKVETFQLSTRSLRALSATRYNSFDGAYAFWGPVNYDRDLRPFAHELGLMLKPGACLLLGSVNRLSIWEVAAGTAKGDLRHAFRRLSRDGVEVEVGEQTVRAFCPSWSELVGQFADDFVPVRTHALSLFLPPPYLESLVSAEPWGQALDALEGLFGGWWPLSGFGDHQVVVLRRK